MTRKNVFFYVQHLLGIGHLKRAATLARAMSEEGLDVTVVSGGEEVDVLDQHGMTFVQLPPIRTRDRTFSGLVDASGEDVGEDLKQRRAAVLIDAFTSVRPDVLIVELYPFGRRQLRFELDPLLDAADAMHPRPVIVSSVRDILVEKNRPERDRQMVDTAKARFDAVMVHGDPAFIPLDATFPLAKEIADMIHYTGYVVEKTLADAEGGIQGAGEVIVSSGSGAVGELLLRTAMAARPRTGLSQVTWRLLAGPSLPDDVFMDLKAAAPDGVIVERARRDFVTLLKNCRLSISQGGYNTVMEILATGAKGIAVPYAGGHETEQTLRTRLLAERGAILQIPESELNIDRLIDMIERAEGLPKPKPYPLDMNGAEKAAKLVATWAAHGLESGIAANQLD